MSEAELPESDRSRLLAAGFRIDRLIGAGAMGFVFQATQTSLNRQVALKVLQSSAASTSELIRFRSEAATLQKIQHPNVVRLLDFALDTKPPYLAMEFVPGARTVQDFLNAPSPPAARLQIARGILEGLAAAHQHEIIHRDLKPANVLLDATNTVRLIDFGLARALNSDATRATQDGAVLGTLSYMSPEQLFGQPAGLASDVYSCALLLIEVLAGHPIFSTEAAPAHRVIYSERIQAGVPSPTRWIKDLDARLLRELTRAVSSEAKDRPQSAIHLLAALPADESLGGQDKTGAMSPLAPPKEKPRPQSGVRKRITSTQAIPPPTPSLTAPQRLGPVVAAVCLSVLTAALLFTRSRTPPPPTPSPSSTTPAIEELTLSTDGDLLVLRIASDRPQPLSLTWTENGTPRARTFDPIPRQAVPLSGPELAIAEDLKLTRADGRAIDLLTQAAPNLSALRAALDRLPLEKIITAIHTARTRSTQGAQLHDAITPLIPRDLPRTIARLAPLSRTWLTATTDTSAQTQYLNALYRAEQIDAYLERSRAPRYLAVATALPPEWSERSYLAQDAANPRNNLTGGTASHPPIALSINGKPTPNANKVMAGPDWTYLPLPALVEFFPRTEKVFDDVLGTTPRLPGAPTQQVVEFEIPGEVYHRPESVLVVLYGRVVGEGLLRLSVNDLVRVPFYCGEADSSELKRTEGRDYLRYLPGAALRPGRNRIRIDATAYAGRPKTPPAWMHWIYLVARHRRGL